MLARAGPPPARLRCAEGARRERSRACRACGAPAGGEGAPEPGHLNLWGVKKVSFIKNKKQNRMQYMRYWTFTT